MLYAVIACEQMYGGMHGMVSYFVAEGTEEEVEEMAIDESYAIMEEYSSIMDDLEAAAANEIGWDEDELDEYMEDSTSGADEEYDSAYTGIPDRPLRLPADQGSSESSCSSLQTASFRLHSGPHP